MKFQCDRCKTRYSIADEKVRGKILKIRCKSCEAIITVRDQGGVATASQSPPLVTATGGKRTARAPMHTVNLTGPVAGGQLATMSGSMLAAKIEAAPPSAPPRRVGEGTDPAAVPDTSSSPEEWYLSVDGEQNGPFTPEEAQRRVARKSPHVEMFAWRDDFEEWLPVEEVPVLAVHLPRASRRPTIPPLPSPRAEAQPPAARASAPAAASGSPLPPPAAAAKDDLAAFYDDLPGAATTVSAPPTEGDDNLEFNIGEASRLVKLPIVPPASSPGTPGSPGSTSSSLPGLFAKDGAERSSEPRADASLKLPIASMSSEMAALTAAPAPAPKATPAPMRAASETVPPVRPRGRRLGTPVIVVGVAAIALLLLVVVLAGRKTPAAVAGASAGQPESGLVKDFYNQDSTPFSNAPKKPAETVVEVEPDKGEATTKPKPTTVAAAPRARGITSDGREGQVRVDPVSKAAPPPAIAPGPPREKTDTFGETSIDTGPLTPDDVRNTYAANEVGLKRCYERSLKSDPTTTITKMVVKITITPNGNVSEITVPERGGDLGSCVSNSIRAWRFRRSPSEFTTEFTVYFAKRG